MVEIVTVEVTEIPGVTERLLELNETERPVAVGEIEEVRLTVPVRPTLAIVAVEVAELPAKNVPGFGLLGARVRSGLTVIVRVLEWVRDPNLPETVIV